MPPQGTAESRSQSAGDQPAEARAGAARIGGQKASRSQPARGGKTGEQGSAQQGAQPSGAGAQQSPPVANLQAVAAAGAHRIGAAEARAKAMSPTPSRASSSDSLDSADRPPPLAGSRSRERRSRESARHQSAQPAAFSEQHEDSTGMATRTRSQSRSRPDNLRVGSDGSPGPQASQASAATPPAPNFDGENSPETIKRYWTRGQDGKWTFRAKYWVAKHSASYSEAGHNFQGQPIELIGDGNCFHHGVARELRLNSFQEVKRKTLRFLTHTFPKLSTHPDGTSNPEFFDKFPTLCDLQDSARRQTVERNLRTSGAYAEETIFQLTALAHDVKITLESLTVPGRMHLYLPLDNVQVPSIYLLIREDAKCQIYEQEGGRFRELPAKSSGHVWCSHSPVQQGNEQRPAAARP